MNSAALERLNEQELAARARAGDRESFRELVCRLRDPVVGVVARMCGDAALAEEAAQEAFLRAWMRLDSFQPERSFRAWVMGIAVHAAVDRLRRERVETQIDEETAVSEEENGPEKAAVQAERARVVRRAVMRLPPATRAALTLREFGGLSYAEIGAALKIPLGTVMSRLNAARAQLRRELAGVLEEL